MYELYSHQEELLGKLTENSSFGIFFECRTGKTLPTLLHVTNLLMSGKAKDCLIIGPKTALGAWEDEANEFVGKRKRMMDNVHLVNYELVWRRKEYDRPFDVVICDESHRIAHRTSKQTKFIMKYAKRSKYRYILTGTPLGQGRLEDLYTQMEFLEPGFFGKWKEFVARYCVEKQLPGSFVRIVVGYRNKEELLERVSHKVMSFRFCDIRDDMPDDLPDNIIHTPKPNQFINSGVKRMAVEKYDLIIDNPAVQMMKFRQVASGFITDQYGESHHVSDSKIGAFAELLEQILPEKIVVFAEFRYSIDSIKHLLDSMAINYIVLDGIQKDKNCWRRFQEDDNIKVIVCQYNSANAGINLWKAHHLVFYEPTLSTQMTEQARARIRNVDKTQHCAYHWLLSTNSIEEKIYDTLAKKQDFSVDIMKKLGFNKSRRKK